MAPKHKCIACLVLRDKKLDNVFDKQLDYAMSRTCFHAMVTIFKHRLFKKPQAQNNLRT